MDTNQAREQSPSASSSSLPLLASSEASDHPVKTLGTLSHASPSHFSRLNIVVTCEPSHRAETTPTSVLHEGAPASHPSGFSFGLTSDSFNVCFSNASIVLTACASPIGQALCHELAGLGANLALTDSSKAAGQDLCRDLQRAGHSGSLLLATFDAKDTNRLVSFMKSASKTLNGIHGLVNCASFAPEVISLLRSKTFLPFPAAGEIGTIPFSLIPRAPVLLSARSSDSAGDAHASQLHEDLGRRV